MSAVIQSVALLVLALFGVYLVSLLVGHARNVRRERLGFESEQALLSARIDQLKDRIANIDPHSGHLAWSGYRKFVLAGKVLEGDGVCSFYLTPHDGQPLPPYLPGQYLTFQLHLDDTSKPVIRCYSLSDSPTHPDYYRITVKRLLADPELGSDHGLVSTFLHQRVAVDDLLDVKAPAGHFTLDLEQQGPVVIAAGGIGITPVLSMLNYLATIGSNRETWIFYGVSHSGEHLMQDHLKELAAEHENIRLHVCYSQPRATDRPGIDYDHAEWVSVDLFKRLLPSNNYEFYTCGPAPMMDQITRELEAWGVPRSRIHFEAFGAAAVKRVNRDVGRHLGGAPVRVEFTRTGNTLVWDDSANSLLEFAEARGIPMDSGCRAGNCGSCMTAIRAGSVAYLSEPGALVEEGTCLTCISVPRGNLVLDA